MAAAARVGALLLSSGHLLLRRRDGILTLAPWSGGLTGAWVTDSGIAEPFTQRVVLFDRRGVWLWPSPLLHNDPSAVGRADYAAFFADVPVTDRLRLAEVAVALDPPPSLV